MSYLRTDKTSLLRTAWQAGQEPKSAQTWNRPFTFIHLRSRSFVPFVRSVRSFVCPSMSELSIPALSTNGAKQDFSTFMYGVWITNLSNSHVDIKEDNINTTSIHRLQNLNVLLMRLPFPSRIHQVRSIPSPVRIGETFEDLRTRGQEESYSKSAEYRASGTPRASGPLSLRFIRFAFAVRSWPPEMFGWLSRCDIKILILTPSTFSDIGITANMKQKG